MARRTIKEIRAEYDRLWMEVWELRDKKQENELETGMLMALDWVLGGDWCGDT
jgi:hypothetical protein